MFKKTLLAAILGACALVVGEQAHADQYVHGYTRSNGTYVAPYYRSDADGIFDNNWSTKPNINPYTGKTGTRVTPPHSTAIPTYTPRTITPSYHFPSRSQSYKGKR
jgi:hypothetical protein